MGGNDQWGNMLAGSDLIRRMTGKNAFSMTFPLITTSSGHKMGKTEKGTVWLDGTLTSPYDYYQYWANTEDADVERFLGLFTFLPMEEVRQVRNLKDQELNMAKTVLAFEATKITHGEEAAVAAWQAAVEAFHIKPVDASLMPSSTIPREGWAEHAAAMPSVEKPRSLFETTIPAFKLYYDTNLCASLSEAKRLLAQGGGYINDRQIKSYDELVGVDQINDRGEIRLRKGKKKHLIIYVKN
jgi:tyrosyl-tRNA synthetase